MALVIMRCLLSALALTLPMTIFAQQYAGDVVSATLPTVHGAEIAFFRISDPTGTNNNLTLINYYSLQNDSSQLVNEQLRRALVVVHGLDEDPDKYIKDAMSALSNVQDPNINRSSVAIMAPFFPDQDEGGYAYPFSDNQSTSNALIWFGTRWASGADNFWPTNSRTTSSFFVLDTLASYFANRTLFPNINQIVFVGHSLGGQMLQRYAAIGAALNLSVPITYWIGNPGTLAWFDTARPLTTKGCPEYDNYRGGYTNFTSYPMSYGHDLVTHGGRRAIAANFARKQIAWARGLDDVGAESATCGSNSTGGERNERFFFFIAAWPPTCAVPGDGNCDTVDLVAASHDNGQMFNASAGLARLFTDNFYGDGNMAPDFGFPRQQEGDDPFPDPNMRKAGVGNGTGVRGDKGVYQGNYAYRGCWTDQAPLTGHALPTQLYVDIGNTVEMCTAGCKVGNYSIAGLQGGSQCWCGNAMDRESAVSVVDSSCRIPCPGNGSEICGGSSRISIYATTDPTWVT